MATGAAESGGRRFRRKAGASDEQSIAAQIGKTGAQVKLVDLASGVLALLAAVLVYLLVLVLLDHWVVRGGLGFWSRLAALAVLVAGAVAYGWRQLAPLVLRRINPVYAAAAIEQTQPGVKNSLINFLLLRRQREQIHTAVYEAVEQQAARDLARVPAEGAVDRSHLIRVLYVLLAVLVVGCVYKLFSPKDPLASVGRMLAPWARWQAPTRVWIGEIEPGTTQAFYDDRVRVSAVVQGLRRGEGVMLRYSTADGQVVDQGVPMELPTGSYRHEASLPAGVSGLKQDLEYWIVAGDATTVRHRLQVVTAPAILIERVEYHYPAYTGLLDRAVERQGDLRGLVGTEVTLHAVANREITAAHLDYDCDGRNDLPLKLDGERGTLSIVLGLNADGRPEHESYQLRMTTTDGKSDPQPVRYRIDVASDQAPELEFVEPAESESELAANGVAALGVRAIDPDFALASVTLRAERGGEELLREPLLSAPQAGEFRGGVTFDAAAFGLKPGDEVQYWAEARDQRQPTANQTVTTKRLLKVVAQVTVAERQRQEREAEEQQEKWNQPPPDASTPGAAATATPGDAPHDAARNDDRQTDSAAPPSSEPGNDAGQGTATGAPRAVPGDAGSDRRGNESRRGEAGRENNPASDEGQGGADATSAERDSPRAPAEEATVQSGAEGDEGTESSGDEAAARDGQHGANDSESGDRGEAPPPGAQDSAGDERGQQGNEAGNEEPNQTEGEGNDAARRGAEAAARAGEQAAREHGSQRDSSRQQRGEDPGEQAGQNERIDPESNPGDAFERILQHRQERGGQEPSGSGEREPANESRDSAAPQGQPPPGGQPGGEGQSGDASADEQRAGGGQEAAGEESGDASGEAGESADGRNGQGGQRGSQGGGEQNGDGEDSGEGGDPRDANQPGTNGERGAGARNGAKPRAENPQPDGAADGQRSDGQHGEGQRGNDQRGQNGQAESSDDNASGAENQPAGEGGKPRGGKPTKNGNRRGGEAGHSQRQPGAGTPQADDRGNTSPQGAARPRERRPGQGGEQTSNPQGDPASPPSKSDHESNSEGGESGERSGGGQQGGGQQSSQPGTGGAGSSTEGNEGAAGGSPGGEGETGSQAGNDAQGSGAAQGESTTEGSGQSGAGGAKPGSGESGEGSSGGSQGGQPGGAGSGGASQPGSQGGDAQGQRQGGGASGGGSSGTETAPGGGGESPVESPDGNGERGEDVPAGDDPNAEYAREATDLVLEYLEDQLDNDRLDPKLLDELHWSRDDIEKFVRRWRTMQRAAAQAGPEGEAARRKLEEALAGLGLRRRGTTIAGGEGEEATSLPVEATRRSEPPPEYLEQFKAFTRGTAKARPKKP